jgi:tRNA (cmo5U34)-methyltransferase
VLADLCLDKTAADYERRIQRYCQFALDAGAPAELVQTVEPRLRNLLNTVSADHDLQLLARAGFADTELFYAGLSWRGWVAYA